MYFNFIALAQEFSTHFVVFRKPQVNEFLLVSGWFLNLSIYQNDLEGLSELVGCPTSRFRVGRSGVEIGTSDKFQVMLTPLSGDPILKLLGTSMDIRIK